MKIPDQTQFKNLHQNQNQYQKILRKILLDIYLDPKIRKFVQLENFERLLFQLQKQFIFSNKSDYIVPRLSKFMIKTLKRQLLFTK